MRAVRVQVSLASNSAIYDRSTETFAFPESTTTYYVNDGSQNRRCLHHRRGKQIAMMKRTSQQAQAATHIAARIYNLGSGNTVDVDTGTYSHFDPVVFSGNPSIGKNQGVTITGPTNPANVAQISSLGFNTQPIFDINNGNFVSLNHLSISGGTYGVWVHKCSSNFTGTYLTTYGNSLDGLRMESDSTAVGLLDHLTSYGNLRDGISVGGQGTNVTNSISHNNTNAGFHFDNSGASVITGNQSYSNKYGIQLSNSGSAAQIGNANLALNLGNIIYNNTQYGIYTSKAVRGDGRRQRGSMETRAPAGAGPTSLTLAPAAGQYLGSTATYYYRVTAIVACR